MADDDLWVCPAEALLDPTVRGAAIAYVVTHNLEFTFRVGSCSEATELRDALTDWETSHA